MLGTYLLASVLHGLWDAMGGLALVLTFILTGTPTERLALETGRLGRIHPTQDQTVLYMVLLVGGLALVSIVGLAWLRHLWRRTDVVPDASITPAEPPLYLA